MEIKTTATFDQDSVRSEKCFHRFLIDKDETVQGAIYIRKGK